MGTKARSDENKKSKKDTTVKRTYRVALQYPGVTGEAKSILKREVAARVRELCAEVTEICLKQVEGATELVMDKKVSGSGTKGAANLASELQDRSNLGQSAYLTLLEAVKGYKELVNKLGQVKSFFSSHPQEWDSFLYFGRSPYAETCLASKWHIKRTYARNMLVGVRNRLDKTLPDDLKQGARLQDLSKEAFEQAGQQVLHEVHQRIQERQIDHRPINKAQAFANKVQRLVYSAEKVLQVLQEEPVTVGWKSLKRKSKEVAKVLPGRSKKYHSALRAIMSLAASPKLTSEAVTNQSLGVDILTPQNCLSRPFSRYKGATTATPDSQTLPHLQPIHLVMGSKYVIKRSGNYGALTDLFKSNYFIDIIIPKTINFPDKKKRLPAMVRIPASHKVRQILDQGANLSLIRVMPPTGPSQKVRIDLVFEGSVRAFVATKHLKKPSKVHPPPLNPPMEQVTHVGTDVNRPGKYILAYHPQAPVSNFLISLCDRYTGLKSTIRSLHRSLSLAETNNNLIRAQKLRQELNLVYVRRAHLLKEIHARCSMELGWQLQRTGAHTLALEGLDVDASGTRQALAEAIYAMPDERMVFARAVHNISALHPDLPASLEVVDPYGTSRIHVGCGGRLKRSKKYYDLAPCTACNQLVNTHDNAAMAVSYIAQGRPIRPEL